MRSDFEAPDGGTAPELLALARVVAALRAEVVELERRASGAAVLERAKGVVMALDGLSADAAHGLLAARAAEAGRSLTEECRITLGRLRPAGSPVAAADRAGPPRTPGPALAAGGTPAPERDGTGARPPLARLADALAGLRSPGELAEPLLTTLREAAGIDAVMIYGWGEAGTLELTGHAGIDGDLAEQWRGVPQLGGVAALEAITTRRPLWLEDPGEDAKRHPLIGDPPERWPARAWIPAPGARAGVVGFLRSGREPFAGEERELLQQAVRLCGSLLDGAGHPREDAETRGVCDLQAVVDVLPESVILLSPLFSAAGEVTDFRIEAASANAVDVAGRRGKELVGMKVLETYPTVAGTPLWQGYLDTLATGVAYEGEPFAYREVNAGIPEQSTYSVRASRVRGRLIVSWIRHDVSEREARRLELMQRLGNFGWADWNLVNDTVTWSDQTYVILDRDPAAGPARLEELAGHVIADDRPGTGAAVERLLRCGQVIDRTFRIRAEAGVRHVRIVAEAQTDSAGAPVEVHGFFQDVTVRRDAELALRERDRAMLVQQGTLRAERALAVRLQHALLPLPERSGVLAGLRVDIAYAPADSGVNVGGDWYSAIDLPGGDALFVVGDVAGHGLDAVGNMAQLRFTAKGMAVTGSTLADVLRRLNTLLLHATGELDPSSASVVMARYHPGARRLTWVRAGHLPPLLLRGGRARFLSQPAGVLLGAASDSRYEEATLDLRPGDHLLFYTDGLIEDPAEDLDRGLARLAEAAAGAVAAGQPGLVARIVAALEPGGRDDVCVLALHLPPDGA
ncbi:SpoIIE family protein phosphatase [Streptomyces sp. NBC_01565]|uniref:SpoIIE family protein phosphatase n=1 Tax=unclassified Streptomyces TaxID=2593676 RepID=UPI00224CE312|nr:SpoIIE family protein phosphatase [Streptomyces sp. NBC_01565]MCX4545454.1 SpoIIE family protein phosphatase [Streptomyces sp. NBC_01565]